MDRSRHIYLWCVYIMITTHYVCVKCCQVVGKMDTSISLFFLLLLLLLFDKHNYFRYVADKYIQNIYPNKRLKWGHNHIGFGSVSLWSLVVVVIIVIYADNKKRIIHNGLTSPLAKIWGYVVCVQKNVIKINVAFHFSTPYRKSNCVGTH